MEEGVAFFGRLYTNLPGHLCLLTIIAESLAHSSLAAKTFTKSRATRFIATMSFDSRWTESSDTNQRHLQTWRQDGCRK